jgi:hypothetical protein
MAGFAPFGRSAQPRVVVMRRSRGLQKRQAPRPTRLIFSEGFIRVLAHRQRGARGSAIVIVRRSRSSHMKLRIGLLALLVVAILGIAGVRLLASSSLSAALPTHLRLAVQDCPFGHNNLREVPVHYGLMASDSSSLLAVDNLEFWPGGCVIGPESEKTITVCATCRFSFQKWSGNWEKYSPSPKTFERQLSPLISEFPILQSASDSVLSRVTYYQTIHNGSVVSEKLVYQSKSDSASVIADLRKFLSDIAAPITTFHVSATDPRKLIIKYPANSKIYCIIVEQPYPQYPTTTLWVELADPEVLPWFVG